MHSCGSGFSNLRRGIYDSRLFACVVALEVVGAGAVPHAQIKFVSTTAAEQFARFEEGYTFLQGRGLIDGCLASRRRDQLFEMLYMHKPKNRPRASWG